MAGIIHIERDLTEVLHISKEGRYRLRGLPGCYAPGSHIFLRVTPKLFGVECDHADEIHVVRSPKWRERERMLIGVWGPFYFQQVCTVPWLSDQECEALSAQAWGRES